jgi:GNAT superfamily N-acetyltransferase
VLFADRELARRVEAAESHLSRAVVDAVHARGGDAFALPIGGGVAVFTGVGSAVNKVIGVGFDDVPADAVWDEVERKYAERHCQVRVEIATLAHPDIPARLSRRGYVLMDFENVLAFDLSRPSPAANDTADAAPVVARDADSPEQWMDVVIEGFSSPDGTPRSSEAFSDEALRQVYVDFAASPEYVRYVARVEGALAGGAAMRLSGDIAQFCGAATLPAFRRRGVQSALLRRRLDDARAAGCALATVTTQPGSKSNRNAQRQGFELLYPRAVLVKEPGA